MDSGNLIGETNSDIIGFVSENDTIIWNTGNQWMKQGNELLSKLNNCFPSLTFYHKFAITNLYNF